MNDDAFWRIVIISVIVVIVIIVIIAIIMIAVKSTQDGTVQPQPTPNPTPKPHHKRCGCRSACDCDKKKECPTCPQCPACPDCPKCMPTCPSPCADCPTCPKGLNGTCTTNTDCVGGLSCVQGSCVCVKPAAPLNLQVEDFPADPPVDKLVISWDPVPGADYYNIFIDGPSQSQAVILFHTGTTLIHNIIIPGFYTIIVFAGDNDCGTGASSTINGVVPGNEPFGSFYAFPYYAREWSPNKGICVVCISDDQCFGNTPVCNVDAGVCVPSVCTSDQQCFGNTPICNTAAGNCVQCLTSPDCPNGYVCTGNTCVCSGVVPAPTVLDAHYTGTDTLFVSWTAVPTATSYIITFVDPINPTPVCVNSMCPFVTAGNITSVTIPPGNAACAPGQGSHVFVQVVTPCGSSTSAGFLLNGQGC